MADVDYGATSEALARRTEKARRIEAWCWDRAITPTDLDHATPDQLQAIVRQALGRARTASPRTWHVAKVRLEQRAAWAAEHPGDPRASQPDAGLRHTWIPRPTEETTHA